MWISCFGKDIRLDPSIKYNGIDIFYMCLKIRDGKKNTLSNSLDFDSFINFHSCPRIPVQFSNLMLVCTMMAHYHNDRVASASLHDSV